YTIDDENTVGVLGRRKNLAAGKIAPFVLSDNAAGLEPFELWRKLGLEFRAVWSFAGNPFDLACTLDQTLTEFVDSRKIGAHSFEHDFAVDVHHVAVPDFVIVDYAGHLRPGRKLAGLCLAGEDQPL